MKTIKYEVKLERSVKIILGVFAFGIILNVFVSQTGQELFGIKEITKFAICDDRGIECASINDNGFLKVTKY